MPKNVEIKAELANAEQAHKVAKSLCGGEATTLLQRDTFFKVSAGRLKLRDFLDDTGVLIFYVREDSKDPTGSHFETTPVVDVASMRLVLSESLGVMGEVEKTRHLYLCGRTRIHIDEVKGLGDFLELEVVMEEGESELTGIEEANVLMEKLSVEKSDLIEFAYIDLQDLTQKFTGAGV